MATKIRPLHDRVIVKRIEEDEKTKGGIIILIRPRKSRKKVRSLRSARANTKMAS